MLKSQICGLEQRIASMLAHGSILVVKAELPRSIPRGRLVSAGMLLAERPEFDRMTAGEAASMTGLPPVSQPAPEGCGTAPQGGGRAAEADHRRDPQAAHHHRECGLEKR